MCHGPRRSHCEPPRRKRRRSEFVVEEKSIFEVPCSDELLRDIGLVLERPAVALVLFVIGIFFIILASKQVRFCLDTMENYDLGTRPREGILTYFLALFVFFVVLVDIFIFVFVKQHLYSAYTRLQQWYNCAKTAQDECNDQMEDDFEQLFDDDNVSYCVTKGSSPHGSCSKKNKRSI